MERNILSSVEESIANLWSLLACIPLWVQELSSLDASDLVGLCCGGGVGAVAVVVFCCFSVSSIDSSHPFSFCQLHRSGPRSVLHVGIMKHVRSERFLGNRLGLVANDGLICPGQRGCSVKSFVHHDGKERGQPSVTHGLRSTETSP